MEVISRRIIHERNKGAEPYYSRIADEVFHFNAYRQLKAPLNSETVIKLCRTMTSYGFKVNPNQAKVMFSNQRWLEGATNEVFDYARLITMQHNSTCIGIENRINPQELFISVIWHDYGKIWDYQMDENGVWGKHNNHARQIHHISRSALEWNKHVEKLKSTIVYDGDINTDSVTHNILSHHGMREWGSPVAPATREAWILHLADNLSARLDDCNKHDIIKH
jgi:hypothetical protein